MDNQQAIPSEAELGWFAGIIDGEGWIGLQKRLQRHWVTYKPTLRITNTDANIIEKAQDIWLKLGVNGHLYDNEQCPSVPNGKTIMYIQVQKQELLKKTLEAIIPYLSGKKARAVMLLRFLTNTVDREEAYQMIRAANKKGVGESSEAICEASQNVSEDMVHPNNESIG